MAADDRVDALVANFLSWLPVFAELPDARYEEQDGVSSWTSSVRLPFFNGLVGAPAEDSAIDGLLERFDDVPVLWVLLPQDTIAAALGDRGFAVESMPGMTVDLATLAPRDLPAGVEIRAVDDDRELLEAATEIAFTTSGFPASVVQPILDAIDRVRDRFRFTTFLGSVDGIPAAASAVAVTDHAAGVYNVGTLPEFRRRGLGALVSLAALEFGRECGCTIGVLESSQQALGVYRGLGFEECCRLAFAVRA